MSISSGRSELPRNGVLYPPASLGVVGSGQLGRMFIQAAQRMGYRAGVLAARDDDPAAQVAHWKVIGSSDELPALRAVCRARRRRHRRVRKRFGPRAALAGAQPRRCARLANRLDLPESASREAVPGPTPASSYALACRAERRRASRAPFKTLGLPVILKTASSGYDGKGQILVKTAAEAPGAWASLGRSPCVAEACGRFCRRALRGGRSRR